jgi:methionyl-tRNA formyltransferase
MRLVFCGTPEFAVPTLQALVDAGHHISLVVTQPDRASGRGLEAAEPAVKLMAVSLGLPITQPEKIKKNPEFRAQLEAIAPDAIVVVAFGRIIPKWMLDLPKYGNVNLHGSLLPKYRGAAPIQWAIANGETESGVTTMLLNEGLDTGEMLQAHKVGILPDMIAPELFEALSYVGAPLMVDTLRKLERGDLCPVPQDDALATFAPPLTRADGEIDFKRTAQQIYDRWRGFQPWPGAFTHFRGKRLVVHLLCVDQKEQIELQPGELGIRHGKLFVGCARGMKLELREVQVEGKARITAEEFIRGYQVRDHERLSR